MATKSYCYMRCSGRGQIDGDTWDRQMEACQKYAASNDMEIVKFFREEGISGTKEDRSELARMMVMLEENGHGIKTVLIEKLDRLSRDLMVQEGIVRDLQKGKFHLTSALEGPDLLSDDPTRKLIRQIFGAIAGYDKSMIVAKLKAARERKRFPKGKEGPKCKCEGQKGYAVHNPAIVDELRTLRADGMTFPGIAELWNMASDGPVTLSGVPWVASNLARMMRRVQ
jgi:DNA invertase Pin-like site-specific DNA recombinase